MSDHSNGPWVFIARHGSTDLNGQGGKSNEDRIRGWVDVPLNDQGREEAIKSSFNLRGKRIEKAYSSDLSRAVETAEIFHRVVGTPSPILLKDLRPWNLGKFQGQKTKDIHTQLVNHILDQTSEPPEGESFLQFQKRYLSVLKKIMDEAEKYNYNIIVFAHYRNLKLAEAWLKAGMPKDFSFDFNVMNNDNIHTCDILQVPVKDPIHFKVLSYEK